MNNRKWTVFCVVALSGFLAACGMGNDVDQINLKGSGNLVEESYDLSDFDRVNASHTFDVTITPGDAFSVTVRADDNVKKYLDVQVKDNTLLLALDDENNYSLNNVTLQAAITMPQVLGVATSGASSALANGFVTGDTFEVAASGASTVQFEVEAGEASLSASGSSTINGALVASGDVSLFASGASNITLTGSGGALTVDTSGGSEVDAEIEASGDVTLREAGASAVTLTGSGDALSVDASGGSQAHLTAFVATDASVTANGGSQINLTLSGTLDVNASGTSSVRYQGDVTLGQIDASGDATVTGAE
jgi:hypothetical protein